MKKRNSNNANKEDYLKAIYQNGGLDSYVSNKTLAQKLQVSPPSVSEMLLKLNEEGYIKNIPYKGAILTDKGTELTVKIVRNHRIFERFLYDSLDYSPKEVHSLAEELEHVKDDNFFEKLYNFLGQPKTCPHGSSIDKEYILNEKYAKSLFDYESNDKLIIKRFADNNDLLAFVQDNDLDLDKEMLLKEISDSGDFIIEDNKKEISVPEELAKKIYVKKED